MKRLSELEVALPEGENIDELKGSELYSIKDGVVSYTSLEARNQCASQYIFSLNRSAFESNLTQWIHLAHKIWRCEISNNDKASGRLLSLVNNEHDVFSLAAEAIRSGGISAFDVLHAIEASLPYLEEINIAGLIELSIVQHEFTKNDLMAGRFFNELSSVLLNHPEYCLAIHEQVSMKPTEEILSLYQTALSSLVRSSHDQGLGLLIQDSSCSNILLRGAATWTIGLLFAQGHISDSRIQEVEAIILQNISDSSEQVHNSAVNAAARCLMATHNFDETLADLAESGDQISLCAIAETLFLNIKKMSERPAFEKWVRILSRISPDYAGCIKNLDYVLGHLIEDYSKEQVAVEILSDWVVRHGRNGPRDKSIVDHFGSATHAIIERPQLASKVITDWLLASDTRLASAAAGLLAEMHLRKVPDVVFNTERLDSLDMNDLMLLARRMLGYCSDEHYLFSLTNSLLNTTNARQRTFGLVFELFVNELGEDYLSDTVDFLETAKASEMDQDRINLYAEAITRISARISELDSLPRIPELYPNEKLEREFLKARAKQMSMAMEEANKGSIVEMIATKIPIKGGKGWFSYQDGGYSDASYLKPISTSISMPRRCVTDEVGQDIQRIIFRNAQKECG